MSGIYIHIPFCKKKCIYCDFHFSTQLKNKTTMVEALRKEIFIRKNEIKEPIASIYFGGGTPSLLNQAEWQVLFKIIRKNFNVTASAEITVEVNPDDVTPESIQLFLSLGINRLSMGIQSFFEKDLKLMNRAHTSKQAENSIKLAQNGGINNISIDLIYGSPTTTNKVWESNLLKAISYNIPHISAYALTVEPKTLLAKHIKTKKIEALDEEKLLFQFSMLQTILNEQKYNQYEVSNFAKEGFGSFHNSNYWKKKSYLGIGPSAHSYDGENTRSWNISNNNIYIKQLDLGILPSEKEILTQTDKYNEFVMTRLRTTAGIDLTYLALNFNQTYFNHIIKESEVLIKEQKINLENNYLTINKNHLFFADGIISGLFYLN